MSEASQSLIEAITAKHGVRLSPDDPLAILPTVYEHLINQFDTALENRMTTLRSDLNEVERSWGENAKTKAERVLALALEASREQVAAVMQSGVNSLPNTVRQALRQEVFAELTPVIGKMERLIYLAMIISGISFLTSLIAIVFLIIR